MLFFIILFTAIAPVVVLFAKGYRFNLEKGIFVYSGSITIKSWPRDVNIYLNGKRQSNKNYNIINDAYTINGVKPGKYTLSCRKEGYTNWEKEIWVHSGISTEFWNVLLFPEEDTRETLSYNTAGIEGFFLSPRDQKEIIYFTKDREGESRNVKLLNTEDNETSTLYSTDKLNFLIDEKENIEWNSDNKKILFPFEDQNGEKIYILGEMEDDEISESFNLNQIFKKSKGAESIRKVRWMFNKKDEMVILTKDKKLYHFDYKEPEEKTLISDNVSGFDFAGDELYYSQLPNNIIWKSNQSSLDKKKQITNSNFPTQSKEDFVELTAYDENRIFVKTKNNEGFLFNKNPNKNQTEKFKLSENIKNVQFSDDGKKILCWNNHEIWYYMLRDWDIQPKRKSGEKITITRFSNSIKNIQWMENYENIIFTVGDTIKSIEADPRNQLNLKDMITTSQSFPEKSVIYDKGNQTLYYIKNNKLNSTVLINKLGFLGF
ncbi:MAG: PEGA domain-containing protein [Candidatus Moraniibacteriota bacterium]